MSNKLIKEHIQEARQLHNNQYIIEKFEVTPIMDAPR